MKTIIAEGVTYGRVGDEGILTNSCGNTLKLDEQAMMLWEMIMNGYDETKMTKHFITLFPLQKEMVSNDIKDFFVTLKKENMIKDLE